MLFNLYGDERARTNKLLLMHVKHTYQTHTHQHAPHTHHSIYQDNEQKNREFIREKAKTTHNKSTNIFNTNIAHESEKHTHS